MNKYIYADNAATTKMSPKVLESMMPYLTETYGNPSSLYSTGAQAKKLWKRPERKLPDA